MDHVPNLGKRYCVWISNIKSFDQDMINSVIERFKEFNLEVSFNYTPDYGSDGEIETYCIMCSSMWTTPKHKENSDPLTLAEEYFLKTGDNHYWKNRFQRIPVNVKGLLDDGYCPTCNSSLQDEIDSCPYCGTLLDWERWRNINK